MIGLVKTKAAILLTLLLLLQAAAATAEPPAFPRAEINLVAEYRRVKPGAVLWIGLHQSIAEGWHTYWRNPGDSGQPLTVEWTLPDGLHVGAIQWPIPKKIPAGPFMSYGYEDEVLYLWELRVPKSARTGDVIEIKADVQWLVCRDVCLLEEAEVRLALEISEAESVKDTRWTSSIRDAVDTLPAALPGELFFTIQPDTLTLILRPSTEAALGGNEIWFFPYAWGTIDHASPQRVEERNGEILLTVDKGEMIDGAAGSLEGLIVSCRGKETAAYEVKAEHRRELSGTE